MDNVYIFPIENGGIFQPAMLGTTRGYMDVSENSGTPKSSILIGFSIIFTIHFGAPPFLETSI